MRLASYGLNRYKMEHLGYLNGMSNVDELKKGIVK